VAQLPDLPVQPIARRSRLLSFRHSVKWAIRLNKSVLNGRDSDGRRSRWR
jgi:hypothetical protein